MSDTPIKAGVIGWPIKHSLSPHLHGWWLKHYGINGSYAAYPVEPENLPEFISTLSAQGFAGVNVTVPHKQAVLKLMDELTPVARRIGAVNTVVVQPDGTLLGDNTDGQGFLAALQAELPQWQKDQPAIVLGAGGAARAVVDSLYGAGVSQISLINRTHDNAARLAHDLKVPAQLYGWKDLPALLPTCGLIVNTSVLGMTGHPPLDLALEGINPKAVVFDLIYNPLKTGLMAAAEKQGIPAINGLGMLLHQAAPGFAYWFGQTPRVMPEQRMAIEAFL